MLSSPHPPGDAAIWQHLSTDQQALCCNPGIATIATHNLRSGPGRVLDLQDLLNTYDMVAAQEANTSERDVRVYTRMLREAGIQARYGDTEPIGDAAMRHMRILSATSVGGVMLDTQQIDPELLALQQSGRWEDVVLYSDRGDSIAIIAIFYGFPDSSTSASAKKR